MPDKVSEHLSAKYDVELKKHSLGFPGLSGECSPKSFHGKTREKSGEQKHVHPPSYTHVA